MTLGRLALLGPEGIEEPSLATRPRKVAVLAWLAMRPARRATRDRIIGMFWGGRDEDRARNSLSDALSSVRRALGRDALVGRGDEVLLADDAPLIVDALDLATAAAAGDHARVVALYGGPFLDGVYVDDAPEFDAWRDRERDRLTDLFVKSAAARCTELARARRWDDCRALAERWITAQPASSDAALFLLNAIKAPATRESLVAAVHAYDALAQRLDRDLGVSPDASVTSLATDIAARLAEQGAPRLNPPTPIAPSARPNARAELRPKGRHRLVIAAIVGALTIAISIAALGRTMRGSAPDLDPRRVVVAVFENRTGDSALAPLGRIAADWISRGLTETRTVEVVEPLPLTTMDSTHSARAAGRESGAGIVVLGAYFLAGDSLGIEASVVDARTGHVLRALAPILAPRREPLSAVNLIRQRVAGALAAELDPRLAGLAREASQPPTYESYQAWVQGIDLYSRKDYSAAIQHFLHAAARDSNFAAPRIWAAAAYGNVGDMAHTDSILRSVDSSRARLAPLDRGLLDVWISTLHGDAAGRYDAAHRMLSDAPASELALFLAGYSSMALGRYDEAIRLLRRIQVDRSGVAWDLYGTNLALALHLAGHYTEERVETRRRLGREPTWLRAMEEDARAAITSGDLGAVDRIVASAATIPAQPGRTAGVLMRNVAAELLIHGHAGRGRALAHAAVEWERARPTAERVTPVARMQLARSLYLAGDWYGADTILRVLRVERPKDLEYLEWHGASAAHLGDRREAVSVSDALLHADEPYLLGRATLARARIAAILGQHDDAVRLVRQSLAEGVSLNALHAIVDLLPLATDPRFDALVRRFR